MAQRPAKQRTIKARIPVPDAQAIALKAARAALAEYVAGVSTGHVGEERVAEIVKTTVEASVVPSVLATLDKLGIDTSDPKALRKDMAHLRSWRELMEKVRDDGLGSAVKWVVASMIASMAIGIGIVIHRYYA